MEFLKLIYIFFVGSSIGSFINVVLSRFPKGESIISPRSFCPSCLKQIRLWDNIPTISWFVLRGRCRSCQAKISIRYVIVEFIFGFLFIISYYSTPNIFFQNPLAIHIVQTWLFISLLTTLLIFDLKYLWLPKSINYFGFIIGLLITIYYSYFYKNEIFATHLFASLIGFSSLLTIYIFGKLIYKKEVIGLGDLKLISMLGIWLGTKGIILVLYISFISAGLISIVLILSKKVKRDSKIAFGPYLIFASLLIWFAGPENLIATYQRYLPF